MAGREQMLTTMAGKVTESAAPTGIETEQVQPQHKFVSLYGSMLHLSVGTCISVSDLLANS